MAFYSYSEEQSDWFVIIDFEEETLCKKNSESDLVTTGIVVKWIRFELVL